MNEQVTLTTRIATLVLFLAPGLALSQTLTVNQPFVPGHYVPMTGEERWHRWLMEDGGSPMFHVDSIAIAAAMQIDNKPPMWGRNIGGFGRRVGDVYGRTAIENTVHDSFGAIARTDTRYFACGCKGFFPRTGHALEMTFLTYNHSGHLTLDVSQLSGAYGGSMISTMWWPPHYSPLVQGVQGGHIQVGMIGAVHILQEFSPELKHFFHVGNLPGMSSKP